MASIESSIIDGLRDALIASGYKVFDSILDRHTGYATKSSTYVMIDRSIVFDWNEITQECIDSPGTLRMRYYQGVPKVQNSNGEMVEASTACYDLERAISQVKVDGMWTRFNISPDLNVASNLRGFTKDYILNFTVSADQQRRVEAAPSFETFPSISGSPNVGSTVTAIDGTVTGFPEPTFTKLWYLDEVSTGNSSLTYVSQPSDDGKSLTRRNFATNGISPDASEISNAISISDNIPLELMSLDSIGVTVDANGGIFTNARTAPATFTDYEGATVDCLDNEIRYSGGRRVGNTFPLPSETAWAAQARVSPLPTVESISDGPLGATSMLKFQSTASGFEQRNWDIVADNSLYMYSFCGRAGTSTTKLLIGNIGITGADTGSFSYDFDTKIAALGWRVEELDNGWIRFSRIFVNNGSGTQFIYRLDGGAGTGDLETTAQSNVIVSNIYPVPQEYIPKGMGVFQNSGIEDVQYFNDAPDDTPITVENWGDSMIMQGSTETLYAYMWKKFGASYNGGIGGQTSSDVRSRFDAWANLDNIQVIWCGQNNITDPAQVIWDIDWMANEMQNDNFVIVTPLGAYADIIGTSAYDDQKQINDHIRTTYPNNHADVRTLLVNSYNPLVPSEVIDFNNDVIVPRLQPDTVHLNQDGVDISNPLIWSVLENKSWTDITDLDTSMLSESVDDISIPLAVGTNFDQAKGFVTFDWIPAYNSDTVESSLLSIFDGAGLLTDSATINTVATSDGANTVTAAAAFTSADSVKLCAIWDDTGSTLTIGRSIEGGSWVWADGAYDGGFTAGTDINLFYSSAKTSNLKSAIIYDSLRYDDLQSTKDWVELNA